MLSTHLPAGQALSENLPSAQLSTIDGTRHAVNLTHYQETNRVIADFLAESANTFGQQQ